MNKKLIAGIVVIVVIVVAGVFIFGHKSTTPTTTVSSTSSTSGTLSSTSMSPSFMINANDNSADHEAISVKKGAKVSLMFMVDKTGVYHGGLQFKSTDPVIDSGPIAPGASKTVTFTADHSFSFQPYWYASGVKKDYLISVNVN